MIGKKLEQNQLYVYSIDSETIIIIQMTRNFFNGFVIHGGKISNLI